MNARRYAMLTGLLKQPTAPFREEHVVNFVRTTLEAAGIAFFIDPAGNVVVGCDSRARYLQLVRRQEQEPLRVFIAHMDHPGFHGVKWSAPHRLQIKWHGGAPVKYLTGSRLWLATHDGYWSEGS